MLKRPTRKRLGEDVNKLKSSRNMLNFEKTKGHLFPNVMVINIKVLGSIIKNGIGC